MYQGNTWYDVQGVSRYSPLLFLLIDLLESKKEVGRCNENKKKTSLISFFISWKIIMSSGKFRHFMSAQPYHIRN